MSSMNGELYVFRYVHFCAYWSNDSYLYNPLDRSTVKTVE